MTGKDLKGVRQRKGKPSLYKADAENATENDQPPDIDRLAMFLFLAVPLTITALIGYYYYQDMMRNLVKTPSSADRVVTSEDDHDMSRFWGTYRPGVYFGTKTRSANSPITGMMWFEQSLPQQPKIRHRCEQNDKLQQYGWRKHNGNDFGIHEVRDNGYIIKTEYVKRGGGKHGGDWSAKISARVVHGQTPKTISLLYYFATDGVSNIQADIHGNGHLTSLHGYDDELGEFTMKFNSNGEKLVHNNLVSYTPGYHQIDQLLTYGLKVAHSSNIGEYVALKGRLVPQDTPGPNLYVVQITGKVPFTLEVVYESHSVTERPNFLIGDSLTAEINARTKLFDTKFEEKFGLERKGFSKDEIIFAQAALSNMLGGIGYFYGSSLVQSPRNPEPISYWPAPLFTAVPSRSFFPRGFLWDEGFHNLLIKEWDEPLSMNIIAHWMDLMNTEGWIPREQILDDEARSKVPDEFVVQKNENANPPTFFLPLDTITQNLIADNSKQSKAYLKRLFPRLKTWYKWFNTTQAGSLPYTYRWKGRNPDAVREINPKTLTSGLDDYPRASHPTDSERHLDLRCWMAVASKVMMNIAKSIDEPYNEYQFTFEKLTDNKLLNELHWSEKKKRYADYGLHTDETRLKRPPPPSNLPPGQPIPHRDLERVVYRYPNEILVTSYYGYVSLFPLLTQILDADSSQLGHILSSMRNNSLLWTNYGLRSLAKASPLYQKRNTEHDPPYWRGAIWININYLAVRSLHHYSQVPGPHKELAGELHRQLRDNIIKNIFREYQRTGYIWEQYDDTTGQGKGCHPFTGWSALVALMMADKY